MKLLKYLLFVLLPMTGLAQSNVIWLPGSTVDNTVVARNNLFVNGTSNLGGLVDTTGSVSGLPIGAVRIRPQDSLAYVFNGRTTGKKWAIIGTAGTAGVASLNVNGGGPQTGAVSITIPTNTNQLTNGAGFITTATANVRSVNGLTGVVIIDGSETKVVGDGVNINGTGAGTTVTPYLLTWIGKRVDSLWRTPGKDSIQFSIEGRYHSIKDSVGSGGGGPAITALTGDGTATGPGSVAFTLVTVNGSPGTFGSATQSPVLIINGKGLVTGSSNVTIQIAESQVTNLVSDLAGKQATGNYITAITGDLAATGPGSVAGTIQPNAVTYAKFQAAAGQGLLGATGAGNYQLITLGTNLSMTGSTLNATGGGSQTLQQTFTNGAVMTTTNTLTNTGQIMNLTGGSFRFNGLLTAPGSATVLMHGTDSTTYQLTPSQFAALLPPTFTYVRRGLSSLNDSTFGLGSPTAFDSTVVLNLGLTQQLKFDSVGNGWIIQKLPVAFGTASLLARNADSSVAQLGIGSGLSITAGVLSATGGGSTSTRSVVSTGTTFTVPGGNYVVTFDFPSTVATFVLTMPASPSDLDIVEVDAGGTSIPFGTQVTNFTVVPNSGQTIYDAVPPSTLITGGYIKWQYRVANTSWLRHNN